MGYMKYIAKFSPILDEIEEFVENKQYAQVILVLIRHFGADVLTGITDPEGVSHIFNAIKAGDAKIKGFEGELLKREAFQRLVKRWGALLGFDFPLSADGSPDIETIEGKLKDSGYRLVKCDPEIIDAEFTIHE